MWPFRPTRMSNSMIRRWGALFAIALSCTLLFQACGGSAELSGTPETAPAPGEVSGSEVSGSDTSSTQSADDLEAVAKEHAGDKPTATPITVAEPTVPVTAETVTYATVDGQAVTGYLAQPEAADSTGLPAIITIHEWWGLNENIEAMTRRLAGEGYTVLAVDLYGGELATEPTAARELVRSVADNPGPAQDNIRQAADFLKTDYGAPTLGVIGWCFGGNWSLRAGLLLSDLDAIAIYYGQLILAPEALDGIAAPVLGIFGEEDSSIPVQDVENFEAILNNLGKPADITLYPGVGHAFANPSGKNYSAAAAEEAWAKTVAFFETHLKAS